MKSKSIPIRKYIVKYGVILGIAIIIFSLIKYLTGNYTQQNLFYTTILFLITVSSIISGLLAFKNNNNTYISLGEALKIGISISVLGGFIVTVWEIILIKIIDPEVIKQLADDQIKRLAEKPSELTQENMDRKIEITKKFTSPFLMLAIALAEDIFVGFLFSLIGGLIIRKKRDPFN